MADKDLTVRLRTEGGQRARSELGQFKKGIRDVGTETKATGQVGQKAWGGMSAGVVRAAAAVGGVTAAVGLARQAYRGWIQDIERANKAFIGQQRSMIELRFMGENLKDPKFLERVRGFARAANVGVVEATLGLQTLESMTGWATPKQRGLLAAQVAQHKRALPSVPLGSLATMYGKVGGAGGGADAKVLQNIISQFLEKGALLPEEAGPIMAKTMAVASTGRVSLGQMGGLISAATGRIGTAPEAATAVQRATTRLMLQPAYSKGLSGNILERLEQLSRLPEAEQAKRLGEAGMGLIPVLKAWSQEKRGISEFAKVVAPGQDIVGGKLKVARRTWPGFVAQEAAAKFKLEEEIAEAGQARPAVGISRSAMYAALRKKGIGWTGRTASDIAFWLEVAFGRDPVEAGQVMESLGGPPTELSQQLREKVGELRSAERAADALERASERGAAAGFREAHRQEVE